MGELDGIRWKIGFIMLGLVVIVVICANYQYRQSSFAGVVVGKYIDSHARLRKNINIQGRQDIIINNDSLYYNTQPGDYIIKKGGTRNFLLVKGKDTLLYEN